MKRALPFLLFFLAFVATLLLDKSIILALYADRFIWLRDLASEFTDLASARPWLIIASVLTGLTFVTTRLWRSSPDSLHGNLFFWSFHLLMAFLGQGLALHVTKFIVGRARPCIFLPEVHSMLFHPLQFHFDYNSFPSGHTQVIFCLATFVALLFPRTKAPAYLVAFVIALTRVFVLKHFPSDVLGGIFLGIYGSRLSIYLWARKIPAPRSWDDCRKEMEAQRATA
jgi:membrane-associated phospholipid phosphatase